MRWWEYFLVNPNSSKGLMFRAERLEILAEKTDGKDRDSYIRFAMCLRELSLKNLSINENIIIIKKLRGEFK